MCESMGYESITLKIGCTSFQIAVLHNLIILSMDGWLASDDFIPHWLAVALLTNANVLRLCGCKEFGELPMFQASKTFTQRWGSDFATMLLVFHLKAVHVHSCFSSDCPIKHFFVFCTEDFINCTLQYIHTSNTNSTEISNTNILSYKWKSTGKQIYLVILLCVKSHRIWRYCMYKAINCSHANMPISDFNRCLCICIF